MNLSPINKISFLQNSKKQLKKDVKYLTVDQSETLDNQRVNRNGIIIKDSVIELNSNPHINSDINTNRD